MTSTSLAELLDPDKWIASGKNLADFPWPDGANEREAMKLILCARPMLNAHVERWSKLVMKTLGRRGGENVGDVFVEEYLRELWERTRLTDRRRRPRRDRPIGPDGSYSQRLGFDIRQSAARRFRSNPAFYPCLGSRDRGGRS
jgi:hypothetical protein